MKIKRYYQGIGYPSDMEEHDEYGDWVKWEDVKPLLELIKEMDVDRAALDIIATERAEVMSLRMKVEELERQLEFERSLGDNI